MTTKKPVAKVAVKKSASKAPAKKVVKAPAKKAVGEVSVKKIVKKSVKKVAKIKPEIHVLPIKEVMNRSTLLAHVAEGIMTAELADTEKKSKAIAKHFLTELENLILGSIHPKGCGEFVVPGLMKIFCKKMPARKPRQMKSPFSGEMITTKAKPASVRIKARFLRKAKDVACR